MSKSTSLAAGLALLAVPLSAAPHPVTVADLMALRSISDVRISPDGSQVAYVVSQPSFEKDEHEAVLYLVPAAGGVPVRLTYATRIFNKPRPAPHLRWSPDGARLSFLAFDGDLPQVFALGVRAARRGPSPPVPKASRSTSGRLTARDSPTWLRIHLRRRRNGGARKSRSSSRWTGRTVRHVCGCRISPAARREP